MYITYIVIYSENPGWLSYYIIIYSEITTHIHNIILPTFQTAQNISIYMVKCGLLFLLITYNIIGLFMDVPYFVPPVSSLSITIKQWPNACQN